MRRASILIFLLFSSLAAFAQRKEITLETIYNPTTKVYFSGAVPSGFEWLDDSTYIWPRRNEKNQLVEWERYDVKSGKVTPLFDAARLERALIDAGVADA